MLRVLAMLVLFPSLAHAADPRLEGLPLSGVRFATSVYGSGSDASRFVIAQVDRDGLRVLTEEHHADHQALYWIDHKNLLVAGTTVSPSAADAGTTEQSGAYIQRYEDGKPTSHRVVVPRASWGNDVTEAPLIVELLVDKKKGIWLGTCLAYNENVAGKCASYRALKVDPATNSVSALTKKVPKGAHPVGRSQDGSDFSKLKKLKAPPGYKVTLHKTNILDGSAMMGNGRKVPAFTCDGPDGKATWPTSDVINWEFLTRPKSIRWVRHDPPVFVATGPATNPIGETSASAAVFRGCSQQALEEVVFGPHDVWFEKQSEFDQQTVTGSHWIVHLGSIDLGTVAGDSTFAIAPE